MRLPVLRTRSLGPCRWALLLAGLTCSAGRAQDPAGLVDNDARTQALREIILWAATSDAPPAVTSTPRIRLPRMPVTSLGDPLGLNPDPGETPTDQLEATTPGDADAARFQVAMGNDNPFLDFRRRGSPGGVGFYKVQTQYQFFDSGTTGCTMSFQAVRPAGLEANGVSEGPSFVSPALTVFHDLGDGTALHAFVAKDVRANTSWRDGTIEGAQYGVALQQPLVGPARDPSKGLFLFVEALGRCSDRDAAIANCWEVVPGLHYRMSDGWWVSGGLLVPVGPTRYGTTGQWHVSCSWQY